MYKVVLKKLWSAHDGVKEKRTYGEALSLPVEGSTFMMDTDPSGQERERYLMTTRIAHVKKLDDTHYRFVTENSLYSLEVIP